MIYAFYSNHDNPIHYPERAAVVAHRCGHQVAYRYGGTAEVFVAPRAAFATHAETELCPECRVIADLPALEIKLTQYLPVLGAVGGAGHLMVHDDKIVFRLQERILVDCFDSASRVSGSHYTYSATILSPLRVMYLHATHQREYALEELAWLDEFFVQGRLSGLHSYAPGRSMSTWNQIHEQERRTGKPVFFA